MGIIKELNKGVQEIPYFKPLEDTNGVINMNVNGSVNPEEFKSVIQGANIIRVQKLIISLLDNGSLDSGGFGNNGGNPLQNGIDLFLMKNGVKTSLYDQKIKTHYELGSAVHRLNFYNQGSGAEFLTAEFDFMIHDNLIRLEAAKGDYIGLEVNDDLTYLLDMRIFVQGYYEKQ